MSRFATRVFLTSLAAMAFWAFSAPPVLGHWADQAVAEIVVGQQQTRVTLTVPTGMVAAADTNQDRQLSSEEWNAHRDTLRAFLAARVQLRGDELPGALGEVASATPAQTRSEMSVAPATHTTMTLVYNWPKPIRELQVSYGLFVPGVPTASCLATITYNGTVQSFVFTPENRTLTLSLARNPIWEQAGSFLVLGVRHILTGYDHILFLITLLLVGGGLKGLLKVVTAFTVAHSVTLSLAVLNLLTLPPRLVEGGIALSIGYVAGENIWRRERVLQGRWLVTFGFGLVHGLGFAAILKDLALPAASLAVSLATFNLGVELGQLAIVTAAFVALRALQAVPWEWTFRRWASAAALIIAVVWFMQRVLFS